MATKLEFGVVHFGVKACRLSGLRQAPGTSSVLKFLQL